MEDGNKLEVKWNINLYTKVNESREILVASDKNMQNGSKHDQLPSPAPKAAADWSDTEESSCEP